MLYLIRMLSSHSCTLRTLLDHCLAAFDRLHVIDAKEHFLGIYSECSPLVARDHLHDHPFIHLPPAMVIAPPISLISLNVILECSF